MKNGKAGAKADPKNWIYEFSNFLLNEFEIDRGNF